MAVIAGALAERFSPAVAAVCLGAVLLLPMGLFPWITAPGPDRQSARDSFKQFFSEVIGVLKRRQVLLTLAMFVTPAASFALVTVLAGVGSNFNASIGFVGTVNGTGGTGRRHRRMPNPALKVLARQ